MLLGAMSAVFVVSLRFALAVAGVYEICVSALVPQYAHVPGLLLILLAGLFFIERSNFKGLRLLVAEDQDPARLRDLMQDFRTSGEAKASGQPQYGLAISFLVLVIAGLLVAGPIVHAMVKTLPLPDACTKPSR